MILGTPPWLFWLLVSAALLYLMVLIGIVLGRSGVNPMWGIVPTLALLLPLWDVPLMTLTLVIFLPIMLWRFALMRWPRLDGRSGIETETNEASSEFTQ